MRISFYLCIVGCITLLCCSCNRNKAPQNVCVESLYCIEIPGDLSTNEHLEGIASLQYWNRWKEFYVFVIDEAKTQTTETTPNDSTETEPYNLQTQSELLTQKYLENFTRLENVDSIQTEVNGMPARLLFITGKMHKAQVLYSVAFIEGKDHLYQVVAIVPKKRMEQYRPIVEDIFASFTEPNETAEEPIEMIYAD